MSANSMWDVLDDFEKKESSGGGLVGLVQVSLGYKVFISGLSQEETFFPFTPGDEKADDAAKKAAKDMLEAQGATGRPQITVQFRMYKDKVVNREVTWQNDRFFVHPVWTQAYKEVVKPAMKTAGITKMGEYWAQLAFSDDPSGRQEVKADGNLGPAQVEYVAKVFKNRAEAEKASGDGSAAPAGKAAATGPAPDGWDADSWDAVKDEILAELGDSPAPSAIATVAKTYGVTVKDIRGLLK